MAKPLVNEITRQQLLNEAENEHGGDRDALAREYCFHTWKQVEFFLSHRDHKPRKLDGEEDEFLYNACLTYYHFDDPGRREHARKMLEKNPALATASIHTACVVGDVAAVDRLLDDNPDLIGRRGGPLDWEPLMYACYSRLNLPDRSTYDCARVLLERGANPNAYYMWGGQYRFTALTGAFGEGEAGTECHSRHERWEELARLLLESGANPNEAQAVYNWMFDGDDACIKMLIEFGLTSKDQINWIPWDLEAPDGLEEPEETIHYLLGWDVGRPKCADRALFCLDHVTKIDEPDDEGRTYLAHAILSGNVRVAERLRAMGAKEPELSEIDRFAAAISGGDTAGAKSMLDSNPDLRDQIFKEHDDLLHDAAGSGHAEPIRTAIELGLDIETYTHCTPLHEAADQGQLEIARLLVEAGADISKRDLHHGGTALDWARFSCKNEIFEYFATCDDLKIFEAIGCNRLDRVRELVEADPAILKLTLGETRPNPEDKLDYDWKTPLASAITRENLEAVKLLLELGAPTEPGPPDGRSWVEYARDESSEEIRQLLENISSVEN